MSNYFCLFFYCCLNLGLLHQSSINHSFNHDCINNFISSFPIFEVSNDHTKNKDLTNSIDYNNFIPGLWRGFHEFEEMTIYYAYQFSNDNNFVARHRIYKDNQTIEDINLKGEWQLIDNFLELNGVDIENENKTFSFKFKLRDDFRLVYEQGSLSDAYQMMVLNKIGRAVN